MKIFTPVVLILICVSGLAAARFQDLDNDPVKVRQRFEEEIRRSELKANQNEIERLKQEEQKVLERRARESLLGQVTGMNQDLDNDPAKIRQRFEEEIRRLELKANQNDLELEKYSLEIERLKQEEQKVLERRARAKLLGQVARFPSNSQGAKVAERKLQALIKQYKNAKTDENATRSKVRFAMSLPARTPKTWRLMTTK